MASSPLERLKLKVQAPTLKAEKDSAFYVVPPLLVAAVFAFCAYVPREVMNFSLPSARRVVVQAEKPRVELPDPNASLPEYAMPTGCANLLEGAKALKVSAAGEGAPAANAVDGSCADDDRVAVAQPVGNSPAWWQVELPTGQAGQQLVIYGGGSKSPAGKFTGGFSVEVTYEGGQKAQRSFCSEGFALEGYETMKLDTSQKVERVRVTAQKTDAPVVLREVQLISAAD